MTFDGGTFKETTNVMCHINECNASSIEFLGLIKQNYLFQTQGFVKWMHHTTECTVDVSFIYSGLIVSICFLFLALLTDRN